MQHVLILIFLILSFQLKAQDTTPDENINNEVEKEDSDEVSTKDNFDDPKIDNLSALSHLIPFEDIAVIQKKYLPKAFRFEFNPSIGFMLNDAFFLNSASQGRLGFYFTESIGLEFLYLNISTSEQRITKNLREDRSILTTSLIHPKNYIGGDLKWAPIYGKMGLFNKLIIPFDLYFALGAGKTKTNQNTEPTTYHLGFGQLYGLSKWLAFRWDTSFYFFNSETKVTGVSQTNSFMNFYASFGFSFFFPGAKYR